MSPPQLIFGAAFVGIAGFATLEQARAALALLAKHGVTRIDSAALYPPGADGRSETLLGELRDESPPFDLDSKIVIPNYDRKGSLTAGAIEESAASSASRLKGPINVLYAHMPDPVTPVGESARAFHSLFARGKCQKLGLCNYPTPELQQYLDVCESEQLVKPSVVQCQYNALCRDAEAQFPLLRQHGISIVAFSPLAGGFLTGKATLGVDVQGTRFDEANPFGQGYRSQYDKPQMHAAMRCIQDVCAKEGLAARAVALRWMYHHSGLDAQDGIILGSTKLEHLRQNLEDIQQGPLPQTVVDGLQSAWHVVAS